MVGDVSLIDVINSMTEKKDEGEAPRRMLESMGWLTESLLVPRKGKAIEGVGNGTLVDLKAQYYASQEQARVQKEGGDPSRGRKRKNEDDGVNPGVMERDRKDRLHLKTKEEAEEAAYAQLEKKAEIYEQLVRGEGQLDEDVLYEVDFLEKRYEHYKDGSHPSETPVEEEDETRKQRRELIMEQAGLTKKGRERAAQIKEARLQQQKLRREKLKASYIHKQIAKMKAKAAETEMTTKDRRVGNEDLLKVKMLLLFGQSTHEHLVEINESTIQVAGLRHFIDR